MLVDHAVLDTFSQKKIDAKNRSTENNIDERDGRKKEAVFKSTKDL